MWKINKIGSDPWKRRHKWVWSCMDRFLLQENRMGGGTTVPPLYSLDGGSYFMPFS